MTALTSPLPSTTIDPQARRWLRLEGFAVLAGSVAAFGQLGGDFLWFVPALLLPDLAIAGYLGGPRIGALVYNAVHNWALGLAVATLGIALGVTPLILAGIVLVAHTGMDRAAGYGLKLTTSFQDTHLGRIGRARPETGSSANRQIRAAAAADADR